MKAGQLALGAVLLLGSTAFAGPVSYLANLNGASEQPPTGSPGTGLANVTIDTTANTLVVFVSFTGLLGTTTASHIHCCTVIPGAGTAGVATTVPTFTGFPLGVTAGTYLNTFDLTQASSYNPSFVTANGGTIAGAEAALAAGMAAGTEYLNIHSTVNPGGEIRGFLTPTPEPATFLIAGAALLGLALRRRRARL